MDNDLYESAFARIPNRFLLDTLLAKRVHQLNKGARPMVEANGSSFFEIALREIIDGKLQFHVASPEELKSQREETKKTESEEKA
ncbi:MAG TPA: DNA-directed RNA polymerase subunit omega [bacterium]|nr:DNA-directed RNA polymerase subunit omega [bacterium]